MTSNHAIKVIEHLEDAAYRRGRRETLLELQNIIERLLGKNMGEPMPLVKAVVSGKNPFKQGTDSAKTYDYMKENPGLRGAEIIKRTGLPTKTVRTVLHRMKVKGYARNEDKRWYAN
jgi:hypothetical protein